MTLKQLQFGSFPLLTQYRFITKSNKSNEPMINETAAIKNCQYYLSECYEVSCGVLNPTDL